MPSRNYIGKYSICRMLIVTVSSVMQGFFLLLVNAKRFVFYNTPKYFLVLLLFFVISETKLFAQDKLNNESPVYYADNVIDEKKKDKEKKNLSFVYDEIPVILMIEGYGNYDLNVIYTNNDLLYVNVESLFRILMIPCVVGQRGDSLAGFIKDEDNAYFIDYSNKQIKVGKKIFSCENEMVKEMGILYLESSLLAEAFGISLAFNYRSLSVILKSNFELPVIKQQRREEMRISMTHIKGETIVDTVLGRNYHLLKFGAIDWALSSYQTWSGASVNQFGFGIGAELLYGEANVTVYYNNQYSFNARQLRYLWRWVDNEKRIIKQAEVGKISFQSIAFYNAPIVGAVIRNSPTTVRKARGYYTINDYTEPNWIVELYINDILVDHTKADASGMYFFEVPNVYGFTTLKIKFYGPMGEERIEERTINIPYTFMPEKEFEYSIISGIIQDGSLRRYAKAEVNYGVNRILTIGGGLEYLSSTQKKPYIPFVKASIQPLGKLTLVGEYAHGVRTKGLINYYFLKNASILINYTKYVEGQQATPFKYLEERQVKLSVPYRFNKISGFSRLDFTQYVYKTLTYNQSNIIFSAFYKQFSVNSTTSLNWTDNNKVNILSTSALLLRLKRGFVFRSSIMYDVSQKTARTYRFELEKKIRNGYINTSYEKDISNNVYIISVGFKCDLSFARINTSAEYRGGHVFTSESAQGSVVFGSGKQVYTSNNSSLGKGGVSIYPFLDLNNNGIFDQGERMVKLSSVKVCGGNGVCSEKDSIIRIPNLNPFISYNIEFSDDDLESIAWRFKNKIYSVLIDPNQFKRIDVPVVVVGEVSGMVYMNKNNELKGLGRILINFYKKDSDKFITKTLSESDGYINYLGLAPGEYVARIDSLQLSRLDFVSNPSQINFTIKTLEEGDIVDGLGFVLKSKEKRLEISPVQQNLIALSKKEKVSEYMDNIKIVNKPVFNLPSVKDSIVAITLPEKKSLNDSTRKNTVQQKTTVKPAAIKPDSEKIKSANKTITSSNINTSFGKISDIDGLFYSVQIGVYKNYVSAEHLKNLNPIFYETLPSGNNSYFSGKYNSAEEAEKAKKVIVAKGIKEAYVVAFWEGVKLVATTTQLDKTVIKVLFEENIVDGVDFTGANLNNYKR